MGHIILYVVIWALKYIKITLKIVKTWKRFKGCSKIYMKHKKLQLKQIYGKEYMDVNETKSYR